MARKGWQKYVNQTTGGGPLPVPSTPNYIVILLVGQSNIVGTDAVAPLYTYDPVNDPTDERIRQWSFDGQSTPANVNTLLLAQDPLLHPGTFNTTRAVGPAMAFARALLPTLAANQKIILVPAAVGGTGLVGSSWAAPAGVQYVNARNALATVLASVPGSRCDYILWWQGENDMFSDQSGSAYATAVDAVFTGFRAVTGAESAKVIIGGVVQEYFAFSTVKRAIQYALADTPLRINNAYFLPPPTESYTPGDTVHALTTAQRLIGGYWAAAKDLPATYTASTPATPSNFAIEGEVVSWTENGAPAYVVQSRAAGSGGAWTDSIVYPERYGVGLKHWFVIPGTGDREARVLARSRAGDSAPSATLIYTVPAIAAPTWYWEHDYDASPESGGNFTSITCLGTDTTAWTIFGTVPKITINGKGAVNINDETQAFSRAVRLPAGSYTLVAAYAASTSSDEKIAGGVGTLGAGFEWDARVGGAVTSLGTIGIQHNNSTTFRNDVYAIRQAGYVCAAWVYDATAGTYSLYVNGALYKTGSIAARGSVSVATKAWNWLGDGRNDGFLGTKLAWKVHSGVLTQAQIIKAVHDIKTLYGVEFQT